MAFTSMAAHLADVQKVCSHFPPAKCANHFHLLRNSRTNGELTKQAAPWSFAMLPPPLPSFQGLFRMHSQVVEHGSAIMGSNKQEME